MAPYLQAAGDDKKAAMALYQWNIAISGAVYEALHVFEIVLRNAIDEQLCAWNATQTNSSTGQLHGHDWVFDPARVLERICGSDLDKARQYATRSVSTRGGDRTVRHGDVVAQLNLGTWRFLLPSRRDPGKQSLWTNSLIHGFPNLRRPVQELVHATDNAYKLRNRVAHLEPLLRTNFAAEYTNMRTVVDAIDPKALTWFTSINRIGPVARTRPTP